MIRNLFGKVKNAVTSVRDSLQNWNAKVSSTMGKQTASASMAFPLNPGVSIVKQAGGLSTLKPTQTIAPNMTVAPTRTSPGGPGVNNVAYNSPALQVQQQQAGTRATNEYNLRSSTYVQPTDGGTKTKTVNWTPPIDRYGRISTASQGEAFQDATGKWVVPPVNHSGLTGDGGTGLTSAPPGGASGSSGADYARNFGSVGQGTTSSGYGIPTSDEEERKKDKQNLSTADQANKMTGDIAPFLLGNPPSGPQTPGVPPVFDAGWMENATKAVNAMQSYSGADRAQVMAAIMNELQTAYNQVTTQMQNQGVQVEDTPAQLAWYNESESEEVALQKKQAVDEWTAKNTKLNELIASRDQLERQVRATDEVFDNQINSIKDNPNLPKALARRQVTDLLAVGERTNKGVLNRIKDLNARIAVDQRNVDQAFQLKRDKEDDYRWQVNMKNQTLDRYLNNPARIATLGVADLKELAEMSGMSVQKLKKMAEDALVKKQEIDRRVNPRTGALEGFDVNTGEVIWTRKGYDHPQNAPGFSSTQVESGGVLAQLEASRNQGAEADGVYADPNLYKKLRAKAKMSASEFDNRFGYLVNPASRASIGVGAASSQSVTPVDQMTAEQRNLLNQAKATIDAAKQRYQYTPALREQIIEKAKTLNGGFDLAPYI